MPALLVSIVCCLITTSLFADDVTASLTFEKDIRPIFRAHCFDCHGATEEIEGGLDLRLVRFLQKGGESGAAVTAGKPDESYLIDRVRSGEMPPGEHTVPEAEIQILERWIAGGAKTARPEPESIPPGLGLTPEERSFWAFQPIQYPEVPDLTSFAAEDRVRTPIDALLMKTMPNGTGFSPDADRRTLVKRAFFDLTGLPPSPEDLQTWSNDDSEDWYDRLLTSLMNSPHYGERWGRHWLDVAGYADSEGATNSDAERAFAWKYRDWVIRAINEDKPFNQFIVEQLAGDELAGPKQGDYTPEQIALLSATGFLRMAEDGTGSGANDEESRNKVMADTLKILGTSLLGLSVQCAQCHDHRYDPIPQTDYYALRAIFEPAIDWKAWKAPNARAVSLYTQEDREKAAAIEAETKVVADEKAKKLAAYMKQAVDAEIKKFPEELQGPLREAYDTAKDKRTDEQKKLLAQNPSVNISAGNLYQYIPDSRPELKKFDTKIAEIRARKPKQEFLRALVEPVNHVPETKLFYRGDHQQPKQTIAPAGLSVAAPEGQRAAFAVNDDSLPTTGRRLAFAKWLTSGQHPLVARVIVNRIWMHHFGKGLVATPADFGKLGVAPSHPDLLDWLAADFMQHRWSLKRLHRQILTSTTWMQSAEPLQHVEQNSASVPFVRRSLIRLDAEAIRDRMLAASGQLDRTLYGKPAKLKEDDTGQVMVDGGQARRSLYIQARRSRPVAMMQAFDAPVMTTNCEIRQTSTVATQALMLMNGQFTLSQAEKLAERAAGEAKPLEESLTTDLPSIAAETSDWQYGFGDYDESTNRTSSFSRLEHWTGKQWQAGPKVPDPKVGWVLLNQTGGHPHATGFAVIRRWTAPANGQVQVAGTLSHGSKNGDGVRGRVVSSRTGKVGEWKAFTGKAATNITSVAVEAGDTIDFITDCISNHTSDSFQWPVTLTFKRPNLDNETIVSTDAFRGPLESPDSVPGQVVRAWELALCRAPTADELHLSMQFAAEQVATLRKDSVELPSGRTPIRQAMVSLCQSLFSSNEFLYVD